VWGTALYLYAGGLYIGQAIPVIRRRRQRQRLS